MLLWDEPPPNPPPVAVSAGLSVVEVVGVAYEKDVESSVMV